MNGHPRRPYGGLRSKKENKNKTDPNRRYAASEDSVRGQAREEKWVHNEWMDALLGFYVAHSKSIMYQFI